MRRMVIFKGEGGIACKMLQLVLLIYIYMRRK